MALQTATTDLRTLLLLLVASALTSCANVPAPHLAPALAPIPPEWAPALSHRLTAASWTLPDSIVVSESSGDVCTARSLSAAGVSQWERPLPFCPERASAVAGGMVLFQSAERSLLLARDGSAVSPSAQIVAAASSSLLLERSHDRLEVAGTGLAISDRGVAAASVADRSGHPTVVLESQDESGKWTLVREPDHKVLTPAFADIDSFDLSSDGREVVFSARREAVNYDVGLVSTDGGDVHWLPSDPADEVAARWSPVGYRAAYLIRRPDGDLLRSIHVPTSAQLIIDFPFATASSWSWSPDASRIAAVTSTPAQADHVDLVSLDGVVRRLLVAPQRHADLNVETLDGFADTILTRPALLKYNETIPLVVWTGETNPLRWDDARGDLAAAARVASVVTPRVIAALGPEFWQRIKSIAWIDSSRLYVVGPGPRPGTLPGQAIQIAGVAADGRPAGYETDLNRGAETVLVTATSSAVVKPFAARYIANRLKGTSPPNDHR
jgi:hypothetical protein